MISLLSTPAAILSGQRAMQGVRREASMPVKLAAFPVAAVKPLIQDHLLITVISGKNDNGIVGNAKFVQLVQDVANQAAANSQPKACALEGDEAAVVDDEVIEDGDVGAGDLGDADEAV